MQLSSPLHPFNPFDQGVAATCSELILAPYGYFSQSDNMQAVVLMIEKTNTNLHHLSAA